MEEEDPTDATFANSRRIFKWNTKQPRYRSRGLPAFDDWLQYEFGNSGFFPDGVQQSTFTHTATLNNANSPVLHTWLAASSHADEEYPTLAIIIVTLVGYITRRGYQINIKATRRGSSNQKWASAGAHVWVSRKIFSVRMNLGSSLLNGELLK